MRIRSLLLRALAVIAVVVAVSVAVALWVYRDIPAAELEARYAGPASRFIIIDGVRMHYRDEGSGPVVVLLHANFSNLIVGTGIPGWMCSRTGTASSAST